MPAASTVSERSRYLCLVVFGVAFAYVEAAVVHYLRQILGTSGTYSLGEYRVLLDLKVITFVSLDSPLLGTDALNQVEVGREAATIVMLAAVAVLAGIGWRQRLAAFFVAFTVWDFFYYVWLRVLEGWPQSLLTQDVFFLIPVAWIGPVATPVVCSLLVFALGTWMFRRFGAHGRWARDGRRA